jgi:hypothetical protein
MTDKPESDMDTVVVSDADNSPGIVRWIVIGLAVLGVAIVIALVIAIVGGLSNSEGVASVFRILRDFFIIVLALQGILISVALVVLILQLTSLINLLRNEIKPLVDEARSTLTTVRGTTQFISKNVSTPVIRVASTLAGARAFFNELAAIRRNVNGRATSNKRK